MTNLSRAEYLSMAHELGEAEGGALVSAAHVAAKSTLIFRCDDGHECGVSYDTLQHGCWCRTSKRIASFQRMTDLGRLVFTEEGARYPIDLAEAAGA